MDSGRGCISAGSTDVVAEGCRDDATGDSDGTLNGGKVHGCIQYCSTDLCNTMDIKYDDDDKSSKSSCATTSYALAASILGCLALAALGYKRV